MGRLAAWYRERPRRVEAIQLSALPKTVGDVASFLGARSWHATSHDVEFYETPAGTMVIPWGDWAVRIHDVDFEVVPGPLFALLYEPSML